MKKRLAGMGLDEYGNPYSIEIHSSDGLVVVVATATGRDGLKGGYGKDSDRTKIITRP